MCNDAQARTREASVPGTGSLRGTPVPGRMYGEICGPPMPVGWIKRRE
jgi:hypothetical protein